MNQLSSVQTNFRIPKEFVKFSPPAMEKLQPSSPRPPRPPGQCLQSAALDVQHDPSTESRDSLMPRRLLIHHLAMFVHVNGLCP